MTHKKLKMSSKKKLKMTHYHTPSHKCMFYMYEKDREKILKVCQPVTQLTIFLPDLIMSLSHLSLPVRTKHFPLSDDITDDSFNFLKSSIRSHGQKTGLGY